MANYAVCTSDLSLSTNYILRCLRVYNGQLVSYPDPSFVATIIKKQYDITLYVHVGSGYISVTETHK